VALVVDTGPLYAWFDADDPDHERCGDLLDGSDEPIVVPAPVVAELEWVATSRGGREAFGVCIENIEAGSLEIADLTVADYGRANALIRRYADFPLGFVDAAVIVICERLGEPKVATLDHRHFSVIRPSHTKALRLLPDA
jgi:predicted nucleic acid-binding protein